MEYFKLLQLKGEPFSNSPDPDYFFQSRQHHTCMQKLELAVRLKRGLNVVIGDVGTGKTTMCRELIRKFAQEPAIETHLLLDPALPSAEAFLSLFHAMLRGSKPASGASEMQIKEQIKQTLFQKGVDQNKTIVLIIDEGQKISATCIEAVRELLNYETNHFKLLQIVIFAQSEFSAILAKHANFADRVNLLHHLGPMNFQDTRRMIHHRLKLASRAPKPRDLFTLPALWAIYRATRGYPRKIVHLCHQSVLTMIIQNRTRAGWRLIRSCHQRMAAPQRLRRHAWIAAAIAVMMAAVIAALWLKKTGVGADHATTPLLIISPPAASAVLSEPPQPTPADTVEKAESQAPLAAPQGAARTEADPPTETIPGPIAEPVVTTVPKLAQLPPQTPETQAPPVSPALTEPSSPLADTAPPTTLGELSVQPGDTFLGLMRLVYGTNANAYLRAVIEANPHIINPNAIDLDDTIRFPALAIASAEAPRKGIRVVLSQQPSLSAARSHIEALRQKYTLSARLEALWTPKDGLRFAVVSSRLFKDLPESQWWIDRLPEELKHKSSIQEGWPEEAILYSSVPMRAESTPFAEEARP
jgi:general secretion pathway protein A